MRRQVLRRAVSHVLGLSVCLGLIFSAACGDRRPRRAGPAEAPGATESAAPTSAAQFADRDLLGELELAKTGDPTFESVASHLPALELSEDASVPENPKASFEVGDPAVPFGAAPAGCRKSLVDAAPVGVAAFDHAGVAYRQTVFGYSEGLSPDAPLWAFVELRAESTDPAVRRTKASLRIGPEKARAIVRTWDLDLPAGTPAAIRLKIPFDMPDQGWKEVGAAEFDKIKREVLDFWMKDLGSGTALRTPEERIDQARRAWLAFASLDVDKVDGALEPHDGAGFYEQIYGYSAALYVHALDLWGRPEEAQRIIDSLLILQAPDGVFTSHFGTPDTGALLFAMCEHFTLTADAAWLKR